MGKKVKKPTKQRGIKGNGPTKLRAGRTYPGSLPIMPDLPGTTRITS